MRDREYRRRNEAKHREKYHSSEGRRRAYRIRAMRDAEAIGEVRNARKEEV